MASPAYFLWNVPGGSSYHRSGWIWNEEYPQGGYFRQDSDDGWVYDAPAAPSIEECRRGRAKFLEVDYDFRRGPREMQVLEGL